MGGKAHLESTLQANIIRWCKEHDILIINIHGGGWTAKGCPDLLICYKGYFIGVELKVGKNKRSEAQVLWEQRIKQAQGRYILAYSIKEFIEKFEGVIND